MADTQKDPYHHGRLREELLSQAPVLIVEKGLDGFTLRELARRTGVTHTATYRHFSTKQDLLAELALTAHADFARALRNAQPQEREHSHDMEAWALAIALAYLEWATQNEGVYQIMFGPRLNADGAFPALEDAIEKNFGIMDEVFLDAGFGIDRARELSLGLMTLIHGYCELVRLKRIRIRNRKAMKDLLSRVLSPYLAGIRSEYQKDKEGE